MATERDGLLAAGAWGAVAGMRTFSAPALLSIAWAGRRRPQVPGPLGRALGARAAPWVLGALAVFELGADQWPRLPARIAPPSLVGRMVSGAVVGGALGRDRAGRGAAVGAVSAAASAFASYGLRRAANRRLPNSLSGLLEDALVLGAGAALVRRARSTGISPGR
jgi:uncharacterized membrane protein